MGLTPTPHQQRCIDRLRAAGDRVVLDDGVGSPGDWRERLAMPADARLILEIGCADGVLLARVAARHPRTAFVGLDWTYGDLADAADRTATLPNVGLIRGRAQSMRRLFAAREVDELWLFHPEPVGPRLLDEAFLLDARALLRNDASTLTLKTDHAGYFQSTLALLGEPHDEWPAKTRHRDLLADDELLPASALARAAYHVAATSFDFWNDPAPQRHVADRAFAGERTAYEQRFFAKRRPIYFVDLRSLEGVAP